MTLPTKRATVLPTGLPTANPTTPSIPLGGPPPLLDPANPRRSDIDKVFGVHAPIICELPIEIGHGALKLEAQLAEHVLRIYRDDGGDAAWKMRDRLLVADGVDRNRLESELVARNLLTTNQKK